jgi:hypothetical protein
MLIQEGFQMLFGIRTQQPQETIGLATGQLPEVRRAFRKTFKEGPYQRPVRKQNFERPEVVCSTTGKPFGYA